MRVEIIRGESVMLRVRVDASKHPILEQANATLSRIGYPGMGQWLETRLAAVETAATE